MTITTAYLLETTMSQFHSDGMSPFRDRNEFREFWMAGELGDAIFSGEITSENAADLIRSAWDDLPFDMKA